MPAAAAPLINALTPPQEVPVNSTVAISNQNLGDERTYRYRLLDQPEGPPDTLVNANTPTPTCTPTKEGTYLLELVVNAGAKNYVRGTAVFYVTRMVDGLRYPAAGETTEADLIRGWATAQNRVSEEVSDLQKDSGRLCGTIATAGATGNLTVLYASDAGTIKTGLPGQEDLPVFSVAHASALGEVSGPLFLLTRGVQSGASPSAGEVVWARRDGMVYGLAFAGKQGDPVYVSDKGELALVPGAFPRSVGVVIASRGGGCDAWFFGASSGLLSHSGHDVRLGTQALVVAKAGTVWQLGYGIITIPSVDRIMRWAATQPGRWSRLMVSTTFVNTPRAMQVTAYRNGAPTNLSVMLDSTKGLVANERDFDESHAFTYGAGDFLDLRVVNVTDITDLLDSIGIAATVFEQPLR